MIDHIGIRVTDLDASVAFFTQALAPLGYTLMVRQDAFAGFGIDGAGDFWLHVGKPIDKSHVAFRAKGRAEVRAFHAAALAAGGTDNGPPGVREIYHPDYYGAFARDLDGHNIEACCHEAYLD
jgi:catechol 2,3-dioxygenase-like lactoylglutathione lyase family enzyme